MENQEIEKVELNERNDSFFRKKIVGSISGTHIIGTIVGALGGFFYYTYVGCASGTCAITAISCPFGEVYLASFCVSGWSVHLHLNSVKLAGS